MLAWMRLRRVADHRLLPRSLRRPAVAPNLAAVNPYRVYGIGLAGVGTLLAAAALIRYLWQRRAIEGSVFRTRVGADVATIAVVGIGGLAVIDLMVALR